MVNNAEFPLGTKELGLFYLRILLLLSKTTSDTAVRHLKLTFDLSELMKRYLELISVTAYKIHLISFMKHPQRVCPVRSCFVFSLQ